MDKCGDEGQAAVESALTLPLAIFIFLGTLQLFLMLQARLLTQHAAFKAARVGAVHFGECRPMQHAALLTLLPSFTNVIDRGLAESFRARRDNHFNPGLDFGHDGTVLTLGRDQPTLSSLSGQKEPEEDFDALTGGLRTALGDPIPGGFDLSVRLTFWYPMRIPFAGQVMAWMFASQFTARKMTGVDPLMPVRETSWKEPTLDTLRAKGLEQEFLSRLDRKQYVFPITATQTAHMMTPPRRSAFANGQDCP